MRYDPIENYSMKCRLYPSKTQAQKIDNAITAVRVFHNCLIYDIWNSGAHCTEKPKKGSETGETVHFVNLNAAFAAAYKNALAEKHPIIKECPSAALITNVGLKADVQKELDRKKPIEAQKPRYYNERHPRLSYTYQEANSKIRSGENRKVLFINLALIGKVKLRGWNQKLRFGDEETDFAAWVEANPKEQMTITVEKDLVGDYFIVFKIKKCLKPFAEPSQEEVGVDVGIKDIAICSDGVKFENRKYKKAEKKHQRALNRRLSRRWGPSNEEYRAAALANRLERKRFLDHPEEHEGEEIPTPVRPSGRYQKIRKKHARLNRKIARRREQWNHEISRKIVEKHGLIAVESLNIRGMERNRHLAYALTDAAFGRLLEYIRYKAGWHQRTVRQIGAWTPSSRRCSSCGYLYSGKDEYHLKPWSLSIRKWTCPVCGKLHDRDFNAACNILYYAKEMPQPAAEDTVN